MRYFFDARDNGTLVADDEGIDLADLEAVKREAARGLGDLVREVLPGSAGRELAIDVRDEFGRAVLRIEVMFEVRMLIESGAMD
jgi:hypothetical protein